MSRHTSNRVNLPASRYGRSRPHWGSSGSGLADSAPGRLLRSASTFLRDGGKGACAAPVPVTACCARGSGLAATVTRLRGAALTRALPWRAQSCCDARRRRRRCTTPRCRGRRRGGASPPLPSKPRLRRRRSWACSAPTSSGVRYAHRRLHSHLRGACMRSLALTSLCSRPLGLAGQHHLPKRHQRPDVLPGARRFAALTTSPG